MFGMVGTGFSDRASRSLDDRFSSWISGGGFCHNGLQFDRVVVLNGTIDEESDIRRKKLMRRETIGRGGSKRRNTCSFWPTRKTRRQETSLAHD